MSSSQDLFNTAGLTIIKEQYSGQTKKSIPSCLANMPFFCDQILFSDIYREDAEDRDR